MGVVDVLFGVLLLPWVLALGSTDFKTRHDADLFLAKVGRAAYVAEVMGWYLPDCPERARRCENLIEKQGDWPGLSGAIELEECRTMAKLFTGCPLYQTDETRAYFATPAKFIVLVAAVEKGCPADLDVWRDEVKAVITKGYRPGAMSRVLADTLDLVRYGYMPFQQYPPWFRMQEEDDK